jgi:hypothetical protein
MGTLVDGYKPSGRMCCLHLQATRECHAEIMEGFREGNAGNRAVKEPIENSSH